MYPTDEAERRLDQLAITAEVGEQFLLVHSARGPQVRVHVCPTEAIDRLLRVSDRDDHLTIAERPVEDLPLNGIRVLELVHQHEPVTALEHTAGLLAIRFIRDGIPQLGDQIVVAEFVAVRAAFPHALHRFVHHGHPVRKPLDRVVIRRHDPCGNLRCWVGTGVVEQCVDRLGELREHLVWCIALHRRPRQGPCLRREPLHHEVPAHLVDNVSGVLDELTAEPGPRTQTQLAQGLLAEAMDGGDRGIVERADRLLNVVQTGLDLALVPREERPHPRVALRDLPAHHNLSRIEQGLARAVPQLGCRRTGEGNDK
ncbi:unannotated protein [freshwater metagenome]|uniref:Unannotated protein n=1 Tax=freshwater metagenome TaxID=449393 RepID=A0A6J6QUM6_9ZZZZ